MTHYSLRIVNPDEAIVQFYESEYRNALDALEAAKSLKSDGIVEVWSGCARIARIKKDEACSVPREAEPQIALR